MLNQFDGFSQPVRLFWGTESLDKSEIGYWDIENDGKLVFDKSFDLSSTEAQMNILQLCRDLSRNEEVESVDCWFEDFEKWIKEKQKVLPLQP